MPKSREDSFSIREGCFRILVLEMDRISCFKSIWNQLGMAIKIPRRLPLATEPGKNSYIAWDVLASDYGFVPLAKHTQLGDIFQLLKCMEGNTAKNSSFDFSASFSQLL